MDLQNIDIGLIRPDPDQPRKDFISESAVESLERLTQSIKDVGIEHPITVRVNGKGYIIIDGERRWRASTEAKVKTMPCIISEGKDILEMQLRSDCLKEGLTVNELDKAIYKYYENMMRTSSHHPAKVKSGCNPYCQMIAEKIGKSDRRVQIAIDRFEFKDKEKSFMKQIEEKHNPENKRFGKIDSTIAMTSPLKNKPEVRKAAIEKILSDRKSNNFFGNEQIRKRIKEIAQRENIEPEDVKSVYDNLKIESKIENDPRFAFSENYFRYESFMENFKEYEFENVKEHIQGELLKKFIEASKDFYEYLKQLEELK